MERGVGEKGQRAEPQAGEEERSGGGASGGEEEREGGGASGGRRTWPGGGARRETSGGLRRKTESRAGPKARLGTGSFRRACPKANHLNTSLSVVVDPKRRSGRNLRSLLSPTALQRPPF